MRIRYLELVHQILGKHASSCPANTYPLVCSQYLHVGKLGDSLVVGRPWAGKVPGGSLLPREGGDGIQRIPIRSATS